MTLWGTCRRISIVFFSVIVGGGWESAMVFLGFVL